MQEPKTVKTFIIEQERIFLTHPIFPDFLEKFSERIEEGSISSNVYFTWVLYWFANQNKYASIEFLNNYYVNEGIYSTVLQKEGDSVVVTNKGGKENMKEYKIEDVSSYDKIKESYRKIFNKYQLYSAKAFTENYANALLVTRDLFSNILFSTITRNDYLRSEIISVNGIKKYVYDGSIVCSSIQIFSQFYSTEVYEQDENLIINSESYKNFSITVDTLFHNLCNQKDSPLLNRWYEDDIVMFYFTEIEDVTIGSLFTSKIQLKGYWCFKWVYDLVIRPHLLAFEALKDGRWSETQFRDYIFDNFELEAETMEELKEKTEELLTTPYWIEAFDIEKLKEFV